MKLNYLNLGCGNRFLEDWTNVDFVSSCQNVISHNLLTGIPFQDACFDVVYHSHVLEHIPKDKAQFFILECYRVLKPGGILRVVIPDLEGIVNEYVKHIELVVSGETTAVHNYDWIVLELLDQMVRNTSGGEMGKYWQSKHIVNEEYVTKRVGHEFLNYRKKVKAVEHKKETKLQTLQFVRSAITALKNYLLILVSGEKDVSEFIKIGKFRSSGEIHQWMYDRFSLGRLLSAAGFNDLHVVSAFYSNIKDWENSKWLDVEGSIVRKPDSLFMEAIK